MGKYKRLLSNTAILGAGTFLSKVLVLLLMPFYTSILSTEEFGTADLIAQTANLLIPLAAVGICDGIFRFTLDASADSEKERSGIFSTGMVILVAGSLAIGALLPLLGVFSVLRDSVWLIGLYVLCANFHAAFASYVCALGKIVLFAVQGILNTCLTIGLNILFLVGFDMGSTGYVLSVIVADFTVTVLLFFVVKLWREFSFRSVRLETAKAMLKFSIPYVPTTVMWLITSVSDRYIVTMYCGEAENGLYAVAYKLPTLLSLVSGVFVEAWHFSTVKDATKEEKAEFFDAVYLNFMSVMCMGSSILIAGAKLFTRILLADSYYSSWKFVPILVLATTFSTLVSFLGSVYFLKKKSSLSMLTAMAGAIINVILNFVMIPDHGAMGAAVATLISYLAVYVIRAYDTGNYLRFSHHSVRLTVNAAVLLLQAVVMIEAVRYWQIFQLACLGFLMIFNGKGILATGIRLLERFLKKKQKKSEKN